MLSRIFNVSIFKSADSVPKNLLSFHVPSDIFTEELEKNSLIGNKLRTVTPDLSNSRMGDPLTALNKRH